MIDDGARIIEGGKPMNRYSMELGFTFPRALGQNLTWWRNAVLKQDMDFTCFVDGKEGGGKSTRVAPQLMAFMDKSRSIVLRDQYFWELDKFERAVMTMPPGKALALDEAGRYFDRREAGSKSVKRIRKLLWECRRRNLFLFFIMPSFYDCDMTVAVHRTRALVHTWYRFKTEDADLENDEIPAEPMERGFARFYTEEGKKQLYMNDAARGSYAYPMLTGECFDYRVADHCVFPLEEYKLLRDEAEQAFFNDDDAAGVNCPKCGKRMVRYTKKDGKAVCGQGHRWSWEPEDVS